MAHPIVHETYDKKQLACTHTHNIQKWLICHFNSSLHRLCCTAHTGKGWLVFRGCKWLGVAGKSEVGHGDERRLGINRDRHSQSQGLQWKQRARARANKRNDTGLEQTDFNRNLATSVVRVKVKILKFRASWTNIVSERCMVHIVSDPSNTEVMGLNLFALRLFIWIFSVLALPCLGWGLERYLFKIQEVLPNVSRTFIVSAFAFELEEPRKFNLQLLKNAIQH